MARELKTRETQTDGSHEILSRTLSGAIAGLVATAPMTAAMSLMHRLLPKEQQHPLPPRKITMKVAEKTGAEKHLDEEEERTTATLVFHFAYGAATGALYAPLAKKMPLPPTLNGIAFGLAVWAGSYLGLLPATGLLHPESEEPHRHALMIAAHVVWGSVTGVLAERLESMITDREDRESSI